MNHRLLTLAAATLVAVSVSACETPPHTDKTMVSGVHSMPPKGGYMPDKVMPYWSGDCSEGALKTMPPEHRAMCDKQREAGPAPSEKR